MRILPVVVLLLLLICIPLSAGAKSWKDSGKTGDGTPDSPWLIGKNNDSDVQAYMNGTELVIQGVGEMMSFWTIDSPWDQNAISSVNIPEGITNIGEGAFRSVEHLHGDNYSFTAVTIPASVESIENYAFWGCRKLTEVTFAENSQCTAICDKAFSYHTGITEIKIPAKVESIGEGAFDCCGKLKTVTFAENSQCKTIDSGAFQYCSDLTKIELPAAVNTVGKNAFQYCSSLSKVLFAKGSQCSNIGDFAFNACSSDLAIYCAGIDQRTKLREKADNIKAASEQIKVGWSIGADNDEVLAVLEDSTDNTKYRLEIIGSGKMADWTSGNSTLWASLIPGIAEISVSSDITHVGAYAFHGMSNAAFTGNIIPEKAASIGAYAYAACNIPGKILLGDTSIKIGDPERSIPCENIGEGAFAGCTGITDIEIQVSDANLEKIHKDIFKNCGQLELSVDYTQYDFWTNNKDTYFKDTQVTIKPRYPVLREISVTSSPLTEAGATTVAKVNRPDITWTVEPEGIIKIASSPNGDSVTLEAIANGQATLKATASDGSSKTATITVQISQEPAPTPTPAPGQDPTPAPVPTPVPTPTPVVHPVSVKFTQAEYEIQANRNEAAISYRVEPAGASEESFVWTISDGKIAAVNAQGYVKGLKKGRTTLTLTYTDNKGESREIRAAIVVRVKPAQVVVSELAVRKGTKIGLKKITKADGDWKVENEDIARIIEKKGKQKKLQALNVGDTILTYTLRRNNFYQGDSWYAEGDTIHIVLHVLPEKPQVVKKIKIRKKFVMDLEENRILKLEPKIVPETAEYEALMYFSRNPAVATVSQDGVVTAVGKGKTKITITSTSLKKKTITIKVK